MALSGEELRQFELLRKRFNSEDRDPIELAAQDMRTVRAAQYILEKSDTGFEEDESELLAQVSYEYMISPEEVRTALEIAEDKIFYS